MKIVVISLSACPTAFLGPYGNEWVATSGLDRLACEGIVYDRYIAECPAAGANSPYWPKLNHELKNTSVRTILVDARRPENRIQDSTAGWDEILTTSDSLAHAVTAGLNALQPFENWLLWIETDRLLPPWAVNQGVFDAYVNDLLDEESEEPEKVEPWGSPPIGWFDTDDQPSWELLHCTMAAVVSEFDAELDSAFEVLRERGLDQSAAWILTAERGFPLGEHGIVGPFRPWLHEELVHLPLIVRLPHGADAGLRIGRITQPSDLFDALRTQSFPLRTRESALSQLEGERSLRTGEWCLILPAPAQPDDPPRGPMLFAKPDDHWEVNDVSRHHPEIAEELEAKLEKELPKSGS